MFHSARFKWKIGRNLNENTAVKLDKTNESQDSLDADFSELGSARGGLVWRGTAQTAAAGERSFTIEFVSNLYHIRISHHYKG